MSTFPEKPYKVAIANGSIIGKNQSTGGVFYNPGDITINLYTGRFFRARAVGDKNNNTYGGGDADTYPDGYRKEVTIFFGSYSIHSTISMRCRLPPTTTQTLFPTIPTLITPFPIVER